MLENLPVCDDAAIALRLAEGLQRLMTHNASVCRDFAPAICTTKTRVMGQNVDEDSIISIHGKELETEHEFTSHTWVPKSNMTLVVIGRAAVIFSRLNKRVWSNRKQKEHAKVQVQEESVVSILLYCSESWILQTRQERLLNAFHMRCL